MIILVKWKFIYDAILASAVLSVSQMSFAQSFTQTCPNSPNIRVEWNKAPLSRSFAYSVKSLRADNGSTSTAGWVLHHRPDSGQAHKHTDAETIITGNAIIDHPIWDRLIPVLILPFESLFGPTYTVSSLTCPDGECVLSPLTGCRRTYEPISSGPKVALIGDSLVTNNEHCGTNSVAPRALSDYCARPLSNILKEGGSRVWWIGAPGQGFVSYLDMIREWATTRPNRVVLAFGTNDAVRLARESNSKKRKKELFRTAEAVYASVKAIRASNPHACIVFVTVSGKPDIANYDQQAVQINSILMNIASKPIVGGNIQIADFAQAVQRRCPVDWFTNPNRKCDLFVEDQEHLSGKGNDVRNPLIVQALAHCFPS